MKKYLFTALLTVLMSMVGVQAFAYDFWASNSEGKTLYYNFTGGDEVAVTRGSSNYWGRIVIPRAVKNGDTYYRVTSIAPHAFEEGSGVTYLFIPNSIQSIGEYAFIDCGNNINVDIESLSDWCNVTFGNEHSSPLSSAKTLYLNGSYVWNLFIPYGVQAIPNFAFYQCKCISSVSIPGTVKTIGSSAFEDCTGLTSLTLSGGLQTIGGSAFQGCTGLKTIKIPSTVNVISINAFSNCTGITDVYCYVTNVPKTDENAFDATPTEKSTLHVPSNSIADYRNTWPWSDFKMIKEVDEDEETGQLIIVDGIYYIIGKNKTVSVTHGDTKYSGDVVIPSKVTYNSKTYSVTTIGIGAFTSSYRQLSSVSIPGSVSSIEYDAFGDCNISIFITDLETWCKKNFSWQWQPYKYNIFLNGKEIKDLIIPGSVTSISSYAFCNYTGLSSVTIPNSVTSIGSSAFQYCSGLTTIVSEIEIPFAISDNVFYCNNKDLYATATLIVPKGKKSAYQTKEGWDKFQNIVEADGVGKLFEIDGIYYKIGENNTVSVTKGKRKYSGYIRIPSQVTIYGTKYTVTSIDEYAFEGGDGITYLSIPSSVKSIGEYAFIDCGSNIIVNIENLEAWCQVELGNEHSSPLSSAKTFNLNGAEVKNLSIPNGVESISNFAFYQCRSITSLHIPGSVKTIGSSAFEDCTGLTSVSLSEGTETISGSAFEGCSGLSRINLPCSITAISINAFKNCSGLTSIVSQNNNPPLCISPFYNINKADCIIWVPQNCVAAYMGASGWNEFVNIKEILDGDVNLDGKADKTDLNLLVDYIMGKNPVDFYESFADLNGDKKVNAADVVILVKHIKK